MKNYSRRLDKLSVEAKNQRPIFQILWCTESQAAKLQSQRPPGAPGEIRYIIVPPEHMPMWFGPNEPPGTTKTT